LQHWKKNFFPNSLYSTMYRKNVVRDHKLDFVETPTLLVKILFSIKARTETKLRP